MSASKITLKKNEKVGTISYHVLADPGEFLPMMEVVMNLPSHKVIRVSK